MAKKRHTAEHQAEDIGDDLLDDILGVIWGEPLPHGVGVDQPPVTIEESLPADF